MRTIPLSLLRGWITSGVDPLLYLPTVLVLLTALLLPLFGRKRHYCNWVCPYGSLQELVGRLPVPKIPVSPKAFRVMSKIRFGVLITLLFYLYIGFAHHFTVLDYEPFSAFQPSAAPLAVIILAGSFVVLSMFVPKLWCRCFCPLGSLLDLSEETVKKSAPNRNQSSRNEQV